MRCLILGHQIKLIVEAQLDTYSAKASRTTPLTLAPVDDQDPLESRKAWFKVRAAIDAGNYEETGIEKSKIENAQRELRKKEKADGTTWQRRYFTNVDEDPIITKLAQAAGETLDDPGKTGGVWVFDERKYEAVLKGHMDDHIEATATQVTQARARAQSSAADGLNIPLIEDQ
jgi:hypothetical protein